MAEAEGGKEEMSILPFRRKSEPEVAEVADEQAILDLYAQRGIKLKDRNVSHMLIREDRPNTFRIMCLDCLAQFDLFGTMAPADATGECYVVAQCMEHLGRCSDRKHPKETFVIKHRRDPIYKLAVEWLS